MRRLITLGSVSSWASVGDTSLLAVSSASWAAARAAAAAAAPRLGRLAGGTDSSTCFSSSSTSALLRLLPVDTRPFPLVAALEAGLALVPVAAAAVARDRRPVASGEFKFGSFPWDSVFLAVLSAFFPLFETPRPLAGFFCLPEVRRGGVVIPSS